MDSSLAIESTQAFGKSIRIVTHCNIQYATRALSLIRSLRNHGFEDVIVLVCHDDVSFKKFQNLKIINLEVVQITEIEERYQILGNARKNRNQLEYFYCVTPFLIKFLQARDQGEFFCYLDSDLFFFSPIQNVVEEMKDAAVGITPHRFRTADESLEKYGKYNVGLALFSSTPSSTQILDWWAERCIESTSQDLSNGVYGDQKYLDRFHELSEEVLVFEDIGQNAAPWNVNSADFATEKVRVINGTHSSKLVYFHFSGLKIFQRFALLGFMPFRVTPTRELKKYVYKPYLDSLIESAILLNVQWSDSRKFLGLRYFLSSLKYRDFILIKPVRKNSPHQSLD